MRDRFGTAATPLALAIALTADALPLRGLAEDGWVVRRQREADENHRVQHDRGPDRHSFTHRSSRSH